MQGHPEVIDYLKELLRGELTARDQYFAHSRIYEDLGLNKLFARIDHEREDELEHARTLIARILFLGGKPNVAKRVPIVIATLMIRRTGARVDQASAAQQEALANYRKTVQTAFREVNEGRGTPVSPADAAMSPATAAKRA